MRSLLRRPLAAAALLLVIYGGLSLLNDPRGYLGTDTGGKVATLEVMKARGTADPDVGYWAERWNPEGDLHPLYYTLKFGPKWVNVTTLPAIEVARPLYDLGGYRLALLVPMLGAVAAALAGRSLSRTISGGDGWAAFWLIALASPLTVYALDFWEHTLGVACVLTATALLLPLTQGRRGWVRPLVAGTIFGLGATMRTETFVYGFVIVAVVCAALLLQRRVAVALMSGGLAALGLAVMTAANYVMERAIVGQAQRSTRALGTAAGIGAASGSRLREALLTGFGLYPQMGKASFFLGVAVAVLLALFAFRARISGYDRGIAVVTVVGIVLLYAIRATDGPGFVPGLLAASPIAAMALVLGGRQRGERIVMLAAVLALPLVWVSQFQGGAQPQWGARYLLASGALLLVVGAGCLPKLVPWARVAAVGLSVSVTVFGLAWLSIRSHDVARAHRELIAQHQPLLVSTVGHLPREGGAFYLRQRWLTAVHPAEVRRAAAVAHRAGIPDLGLVSLAGDRATAIPGWQRGTRTRLRLFSGVDLTVTRFHDLSRP